MIEINSNRAPDPIVTVQSDPRANNRLARNVFLKVVSATLLFSTVLHWMQVMGISGYEPNGFDTMSLHWQFMIVILCVAEPVAALGLWGGFSWGVVVWLSVAVAQIFMHGWFGSLFGYHPKWVLWQLSTVVIFIFIEFSIFFMPNKKLSANK